jgi:hypothetical protein
MSLCRLDISIWEAVFIRLMQRDLCNSTCRLWPLISTTTSGTTSCSLYSASPGSRQGPCGLNFWGLIDPANDIPYPVPVDPKRKEAWDSDFFGRAQDQSVRYGAATEESSERAARSLDTSARRRCAGASSRLLDLGERCGCTQASKPACYTLPWLIQEIYKTVVSAQV